MNDRRVHVEMPGKGEVVRYDRAGKWYIEWIDPTMRRRQITISEAVAFAKADGMIVKMGVPGGQTFDRMMTR